MAVFVFTGRLLLWTGTGLAQEKPPQKPLPKAEVFQHLKQSIEPLAKGTISGLDEEDSKKVGKLAEGISRRVEYLEDVSRNQDIPEAYLLSMTRNSWLLKRSHDLLGKKGKEQEKGLEFVQVVANDFESKMQSAMKANGKSKLIKVVANTKNKNAGAVNGYEVWYVSQGMVDYPDLYARFGKISTPTDEDLIPGEYFMWTEKDQQKGKRTPVKIRDNGTGRKEVDLLIP
jgi:hypothetical protein